MAKFVDYGAIASELEMLMGNGKLKFGPRRDGLKGVNLTIHLGWHIVVIPFGESATKVIVDDLQESLASWAKTMEREDEQG